MRTRIGEAIRTGEATGLRARVWIPAHCFFSRADTQHRCWLWLLHHDGLVRALTLPVQCLDRDDLLPGLARPFQPGSDATVLADPAPGPVRSLPNAPVVPLSRWAVSWGHPVQRAIRAFAGQLDNDTLETLGDLEVPGPFFGSVQNYNRLVAATAPLRRHRLRALADFPAWLAPMLLEPSTRPDMFGDEDDDDHPWRHRRPPDSGPPHLAATLRRWRGDVDAVLEAIDRGRDLIGAIAGFHGVDRALVRSRLGREPWRSGGIPPVMLSMLNAIPAHARPARREDVESRLERFDALPVRLQSDADARRLAHAFKAGWNPVWQELERDVPALPQALRNSRDFLAAAIGEAVLPAGFARFDVHQLALAWLARRGLRSLLDASRRWHAQPMQQRAADTALPDDVPPLFGEWRTEHGIARELTRRQALIDEGNTMHHCVADYWRRCVFDGTRIVHLELPDGQAATAQYDMDVGANGQSLFLQQLSGPCNEEPGETMERLAEDLGQWLRAEEREPERRLVAESARSARERGLPFARFQSQRALDARSRAELAQVLAYATTQPDWRAAANELLCSHVAGFHYGHGPYVLDRLDIGDTLTLAREPENPYDRAAVRIEWNGAKLGYVPRAENAPIARLLDQGQPLSARIQSLDRSEARAPVKFVIERAA